MFYCFTFSKAVSALSDFRIVSRLSFLTWPSLVTGVYSRASNALLKEKKSALRIFGFYSVHVLDDSSAY